MGVGGVFWWVLCVFAVFVVVFNSPVTVTAGDIVHDDSAPKKPGCENDFVLVILILLVFSFDPLVFTVFIQLGVGLACFDLYVC